MIEQLEKAWPIMCGHQGFFAAIIAWRGFLAFAVPIFNAKLQSKFTELLADSPNIANEIVHKRWWKITDLILRMTIDIRLPNESSLVVLDAKRQTEFVTKNENKN